MLPQAEVYNSDGIPLDFRDIRQMTTILIAGKFAPALKDLEKALKEHGFTVFKAPDLERELPDIRPDLVLLDFTSAPGGQRPNVISLIARTKEVFPVPVIAFTAPESLDGFEPVQGIDDFMVLPCRFPELQARIKQTLWKTRNLRSEDIVKHGDLVIDLVSYKVFLGGKLVDLTFKEYELLRFLAGNPGKVYSREALLNQVWGYDYYGGDRTVDVHIRRLRSKIEDATHSFIETVWNVGYRFKEQ